ncbi:5'/3'-nucleotidase SurE [Labedaea rhizosphaerae]|uniref:5'/3'-nucleotidase SurE n=1 Tax=Labedaea rhizosphaerae TaxID=598644 RepID=UPI00106116F7|nr:5'/3'-nucleotidase SurE [Labedaea rhizosphaerae]
MRPRILVTNDDGIDSPGLHALARCALPFGDVLVAAPATEVSGTGAGLMAATDHREVAVERRAVPGAGYGYAVAAHPGLIALIACHDGFGPRPHVVLSGVNRGGNVGRGVLHSGTVGAALTAGINGARALAMSVDLPLDYPGEVHWSAATAVVADVLPLMLDADPGTTFNLNVPNAPTPGDLRWATLATSGRVQSSVTSLREGKIAVRSVVVDGELEPGTDAALLAQGYSTITPLRSVAEAPELFPVRSTS